MSFFRDNIESLQPYVPGEQPAAGRKVIKLNTNENPYPPSPAAMKVLREFDADALRRYPHPFAQRVRDAAAKVFDVPAECVLVGNGSDELLTMIMRGVAAPGRAVVYPTPTYVLYPTLAKIQDAQTVEVPFDEDYNLPLDALADAGGAVTFVASPNSPSGASAGNEQLRELASRCDGLVVVDEAYADFADTTALELVGDCGNLLVLRSLSKGYSLAGLRVGFAVADPAVIETLSKVKDSYNVDAVACAAGAAAIDDQAHKNANAEKVKASRTRLAGALAGCGFRVWPSQANFLLARPPAGDAQRLYEGLKACGILVRYFQQPRLDDKLRITVGTDRQNDELVSAVKKLLKA